MSQAADTHRALAVRPATLSVAIGVLGAALFWLLSVGTGAAPVPNFGMDIYDQAWLALREGRLDLPARVLRIEGHYTPDGTAYYYHGIAPLITRALFDPFVTIGAAPLSAVSIWIWTMLGTGFWHALVLRMAAPATAVAAGILGTAVWVAGPGVMLVSSHALYHEPIALAYALAAAFAYAWVAAETSGRGLVRVLIVLAALAALCVHARPNLAVGLYAATGFAVLRALWITRVRAVLPGLVALALLGAGGAGYLALNEARFGGAAETHGSFDAGEIQYGTVYWGFEAPDGARPRGFIDHGRFNALRILPNAVLYYIGPPQLLLPDLYDRARIWHHEATRDRLGFIRVEGPGAGILGLWTIWAALAVVGLCALTRQGRPYAGLLAGLGAASLLTLSYGTVTLRYTIDLFPLVMVLAALGLADLAPRLSSAKEAPRLMILLTMLTLAGASISLRTGDAYRLFFREHPGSAFAPWSLEDCARLAGARGFAPERVAEICRAPRIET